MKTSLAVKIHHVHPHFRGGGDEEAEAKRPDQVVTLFFLYCLLHIFSGFISEKVILLSYAFAFITQIL